MRMVFNGWRWGAVHVGAVRREGWTMLETVLEGHVDGVALDRLG